METTIRTPNNIYIFKKIDKEKCCMGQIDAQAKEEHPFSIDVKGEEKVEKGRVHRQGEIAKYKLHIRLKGFHK